MKISKIFSHLLINTLIIPALLISSDLEEKEGNEFSINCCSKQKKSKKNTQAIFASFRNNQPQDVPTNQNVKFNIVDANKGNGIIYNFATGEFLINKSSYYIIDYGVFGDPDSLHLEGIFLIRVRNGIQTKVDANAVDNSSSIILSLKKNDIIKIIGQLHLHLNPADMTTIMADSAYITFLRLEKHTRCQ